MPKKILFVPTLIFLFFFFALSVVSGQQTIRFKSIQASATEDLVYKEHFSDYTLATIGTETTSDLLRSKDYFSELTIESGDRSFSFSLLAHDIRAPHYKLTVADDLGERDLPRTPNTTYRGYTKGNNYDVRVTADEGFFTAMIMQPNDKFFIEPAANFFPAAAKNQFVLYWSSHNIKKLNNGFCGLGDAHSHTQHAPSHEETPQMHDSRMVCKTLELALANDFEMFQEKGSAVAVQNHNMAVINNVLTNYDTEFTIDLEFDVVQIYVATSNGSDPWTNSTNANTLLDDFTDWGPTGFSNTHDVGTLWTNRDFDGDVVGLAWIAAVCTNFKYHTLQDFGNNADLLQCLQAHEMGHNFSANHDAAGSNTIMAPSVQATDLWSNQSLNAINNFMAGLTCLGPCGSPMPPVADFTSDAEEGCVPFVVHFFDDSENSPTNWSWTFQGGTPPTSTSPNPTVTYNTPGVYDVSLTVSNPQGSDSEVKQDFITVGDDPIADFDYFIDELLVDFENTSEDANSYFWNFGDGTTSTQTNPTHEYDEDGIYEITLTATNECGSDLITIEIEIITLPVANFTASDVEGCDPFEIEFNNLSSDNANSFFWSFPGGSPPSSSSFEPNIVYEIPGVYSVTLTATNDAGDDIFTRTNYITVLPQPNAVFTVDPEGLEAIFSSAGSVGDTYSWNFGDGGTSTNPNPTHIYAEGGAYTVTLTVTNECGSDVQTMVVTIIASPVAAFASNVTQGCAPLVVQYTNQSIGIVNSFSWVFQGGTPATSSLSNPVVTYNSPGVYDVTLTVANAVGSDVQFNDNYITVHGLPISDFDFVVNGNQVAFTNLSSGSTGSTWNFGDGLVSDDTNPVHSYANEGVYTVTLITQGLCGNDTSTAQVTVQNPPSANFTFQQANDCAPASVQFTNQSSSNVTSYKWTFPGGTPSTSTQANPVVTYNAAGSYDVQLIVFAPAGSDTIDMFSIIDIGLSPEANFLLTTNGTTIELENISSNASSYEWLFGDGQFTNEENPTHTYSEFGTYVIDLIATNDCGDDTMSIEIVLGNLPNASFTYDDQNGCAPFQVQFIDQSQNNPTAWLWTFEGGDPSSSTLQNPVITYPTPGAYMVTLQVTNTQGSDVLVLDDVIHVANAPDATFDPIVVGNIVSLNYNGTDYDSLRWDFGDGRTDNAQNPTVDYSTSGEYVISLTVYNACGSDTKSKTVFIEGTSTSNPNTFAGWRINPNPFVDGFGIYGNTNTDGFVSMTLTDIHGKVISNEKWWHPSGPVVKKISTDHLPSGIILVVLQDANSRMVLRGIHQD